MEAAAPADAIAGNRWYGLWMTRLCWERRECYFRAITTVAVRRINGKADYHRAQQPYDNCDRHPNAMSRHIQR